MIAPSTPKFPAETKSTKLSSGINNTLLTHPCSALVPTGAKGGKQYIPSIHVCSSDLGVQDFVV